MTKEPNSSGARASLRVDGVKRQDRKVYKNSIKVIVISITI